MAEHTLLTTAPTLGKGYRSLRVNAKKIENNDVEIELSEHGDSGLTFVGCGEKIEGHSLDIVDPDKNSVFARKSCW